MFQAPILKFDTSETKVEVRSGKFNIHQPSDEEDFSRLLNCYIIDQVSVAIPNCRAVPGDLAEYIKHEGLFYEVKDLTLSEIISKDFVENFVLKGDISIGVSNGYDIDDNFIALSSNGILCLSLNHSTYLELGIEGSKSKIKGKYEIFINTKSPNFLTTKRYKRLQWCLTDRLELKFNVMLDWIPHETSICPSSVAKYFSVRGFSVKQVPNYNSTSVQYSLRTPDVSSIVEEPDLFIDWLGASLLGLKSEEFCMDEDAPECPHMATQVISGLLHYCKLKTICTHLQKYLDSNDDIQWVAVVVHNISNQIDLSRLRNKAYPSLFQLAALIITPNNPSATIITIKDE